MKMSRLMVDTRVGESKLRGVLIQPVALAGPSPERYGWAGPDTLRIQDLNRSRGTAGLAVFPYRKARPGHRELLKFGLSQRRIRSQWHSRPGCVSPGSSSAGPAEPLFILKPGVR